MYVILPAKIQFCLDLFKIEKRKKNDRPEKPFMTGIKTDAR